MLFKERILQPIYYFEYKNELNCYYNTEWKLVRNLEDTVSILLKQNEMDHIF